GRSKRAYDCGFENIGMFNKHAFDLGWRYPYAADLHHVVVAAEELVVAVVGTGVHVTRAQPFADECGSRGIGATPVSGGGRRTPHVQETGGVGLLDLGA